MITYNPSDPQTEIIFNHRSVAYEKRRLVLPSASFFLGEWVGLGAKETAIKITTAVVSAGFVMPRMVYTETGRHDVAESEGVTVVLGFCFISTMNYETGQTFAVGDPLMVLTNTAAIGTVGTFGTLANWTTGLYVVGRVRVPPAVDGTSRLIAEIYPVAIVPTTTA